MGQSLLQLTVERFLPVCPPDRFWVVTGVKDRFSHVHGQDEILARYGDRITMCQRIPDVFAAAMGNQLYMAVLDTEDEVRDFAGYILDEQAKVILPTLFK